MAVMREMMIAMGNFMLAWTFFGFGFDFGCGQVLVLGEAEYLVSTGVSVWRGWRGGACLVWSGLVWSFKCLWLTEEMKIC